MRITKLFKIVSVKFNADGSCNIIGVIPNAIGGMYEISTSDGRIQNWLHRNAFEKTDFKELLREDVPNVKYSVCEIVRLLSVETGQIFKICYCVKGI